MCELVRVCRISTTHHHVLPILLYLTLRASHPPHHPLVVVFMEALSETLTGAGPPMIFYRVGVPHGAFENK